MPESFEFLVAPLLNGSWCNLSILREGENTGNGMKMMHLYSKQAVDSAERPGLMPGDRGLDDVDDMTCFLGQTHSFSCLRELLFWEDLVVL